MQKLLLFFVSLWAPLNLLAMDKYQTSAGEIGIQPLGHGSVMITWQGKVIQVDPYGEVADYDTLPKADLILLTHEHYDHYDPTAFRATAQPTTTLIGKFPPEAAAGLAKAVALNNGDQTAWEGIAIKAIPAYNIVHLKAPGQPFHPKGYGNGYILEAGGLRIYIGGDTELIPEMKELGPIDIAFLPQNLPYTMDPEMFLEAVRLVAPRVLYPYHYFEIDRAAVEKALPGIEVKWK